MTNTRKQKQEETRVLIRNLEATIKELPVTLKTRCLESLGKFAIRVRNYERLSAPYEKTLEFLKEIPVDNLFTPKDVAREIETNVGTASRTLRYVYRENPEVNMGLLFTYKHGWFYRGQDAESEYIKLPERSAPLNEDPPIKLQGINTEAMAKEIKEVLNYWKERDNREWTDEEVEDFKGRWIEQDKRAVISFAKKNIQEKGYVSVIPTRILEEDPFSHYNELTRERNIDINLYKKFEDSPQFYLFAEKVLRGMRLREARFLQPQEDTERRIFYHPARLRELRRDWT